MGPEDREKGVEMRPFQLQRENKTLKSEAMLHGKDEKQRALPRTLKSWRRSTASPGSVVSSLKGRQVEQN